MAFILCSTVWRRQIQMLHIFNSAAATTMFSPSFPLRTIAHLTFKDSPSPIPTVISKQTTPIHHQIMRSLHPPHPRLPPPRASSPSKTVTPATPSATPYSSAPAIAIHGACKTSPPHISNFSLSKQDRQHRESHSPPPGAPQKRQP